MAKLLKSRVFEIDMGETGKWDCARAVNGHYFTVSIEKAGKWWLPSRRLKLEIEGPELEPEKKPALTPVKPAPERIEFDADPFSVADMRSDSTSMILAVKLPAKCDEFTRYHVTLTPVEPELKPCPRCDGEMYMLPGINVWTTQCRQCRRTGPVLRTKVAAINAHNERKYPELDPCPFCGGEVAFGGKSANPWAQHVAECTNCHVAMGRARRDDAVADWNRRA